MLFSIKNRFVPALLLLVLFVAGALLARHALHLTWRLEVYPGFARQLTLALGVIAVSDALLHGGLWLALRDRYLTQYGALVAYFRPQGPLEIAAGGLLAGGEEMVFRGVLLEALMSRAEMGPVGAIALAALAFGALHVPRDRPAPSAFHLAPFALWAVWEGVLLGGLYVATGSLLLLMVAHALHDVAGFSLFAWQRRTGWLLAPAAGGPGGRPPSRRWAGSIRAGQAGPGARPRVPTEGGGTPGAPPSVGPSEGEADGYPRHAERRRGSRRVRRRGGTECRGGGEGQ
jgi:membrane protease YdiL (CAAX protease family)